MQKGKLVYLLPGRGGETYKSVLSGEAPRERLFGAVQLIERGWDVTICDAQWEGWGAPLRKKLARWVEVPAIKTCIALWQADLAIIQGRIATLLLLVAKALGKKVVYIDAMFDLPKRRIKKWIYDFNLNISDAILSYSSEQIKVWREEYGIPEQKMLSARYPMDSAFYEMPVSNKEVEPYVFAVGRDPGRDFSTLLSAARLCGISTRLVTLPYLLPSSWNETSQVEVYQRLTYQELFNLYAQAKVSVIPLKSGISYPSGIRASLEAMLLRVPVIATYTDVLAEEFEHEVHLLYVEPQNPAQLADAIKRILHDRDLAERLVENAWRKVTSDFGVEQFADRLESLFIKLL